MRNRVAITGYGAVCGLGNCVDEITEAVRAGKPGVRLVASDPVAPPVVAGCPLLEDAYAELSVAERALLDPVSRYALLAATEAMGQSGLLEERSLRDHIAVYLGTAMGGTATTEDAHRDIWYHGTPPKPLTVLCAMSNAPAAHLSIRFGLRGPNLTYSVACASSAIAIGEAFHAVRDGRVACVLAGGSEACVTPAVLRAWQSMRILAAVDRNSPGSACRPFARDRSGLVLGEGAAMLVLERMDVAQARGAPILCELLGYGCVAEASHICIPSSDGQYAAMAEALNDASLNPNDIEYINAHGTGTRIGDTAEARAIQRLLGEHAGAIPVSSTKPAHGHLLGGAGALELVLSVAALRSGFLPPTLNLHLPDPECLLDHVAQVPRPTTARTLMTNSFAFGGSDAVLVASVECR